MREPAYYIAAGDLAERRAVEIRARLRARPHTQNERDDAEILATIYEAAAFDLLARGPRPAPATPESPKATKACRRAAQSLAPPVEAWREEMTGLADFETRKKVLERALAAVDEREQLVGWLLTADERLEKLNAIIARVAEVRGSA